MDSVRNMGPVFESILLKIVFYFGNQCKDYYLTLIHSNFWI